MKKIISFAALVAALIPSQLISQCLVASYNLDGQALDGVGTNNGTLYGATATTDRFGNANSALHFDGSSGYAVLPSNFDYPQRTISFWMKAANISTTIGVMFESDNSGTQYGQTQIGARNFNSQDGINFCIGLNVYDQQPVSLNAWYHVTVVRDVSEIRYYLNCELVSTLTDMSNVHSGAQNFVNTYLGRAADPGGYYFNGDMDDLKVYNCALTNAQVGALCIWSGIDEHASDITASANIISTSAFAISDLLKQTNTNEKTKIRVTNMLGQVVYESSVNSGIPVSAPPVFVEGIYIYSISSKEGEKRGFIEITGE